MSSTFPIPGGEVTLRDPATLKESSKRRIKARLIDVPAEIRQLMDDASVAIAQAAKDASTKDDPSSAPAVREVEARLNAVLTGDAMIKIEQLTDQALAETVESWTIDLALPTTAEEFAELPGDVYDRLSAVIGMVGIGRLANGPDFSPQVDEARATPTTP